MIPHVAEHEKPFGGASLNWLTADERTSGICSESRKAETGGTSLRLDQIRGRAAKNKIPKETPSGVVLPVGGLGHEPDPNDEITSGDQLKRTLVGARG